MTGLNIKGHLPEFFTAILIFLLMEPGIMWGIDPTLFRIALIFVLLLKLDLRERTDLILFVFFFLLLSINPISHNYSLFGFVYFTTLALIPFANNIFLSYSFRLFKWLLSIVTLISLIFWILIIIVGIDFPYTVIDPLNELKDYTYRSYGFLLVPQTILNFDLIKFNCVFDEPGVVGTYSLLMLFSDNFNWKNRENWIYLASGAASFSFFFYLGLIMLLLMNLFTSKAKKKYKILAVAFSLAIVVGIQTVPILYDMVGYRLEYDSDTGKLAGDNRSSEDLDNYIVSISGSSAYLWGASEDVVEYYQRHAGLSTAILRYGVVMIILYILFFTLYCYYKSRERLKATFIFLLVMMMTLYQRPGIASSSFIFMFSGIVINRALQYKNNRYKIIKNVKSRCLSSGAYIQSGKNNCEDFR